MSDAQPAPTRWVHCAAGDFRETLRVAATSRAGRPSGLVGREVANREFLRALLRHGDVPLGLLLDDARDAKSLETLCHEATGQSLALRGVTLRRTAGGPLGREQPCVLHCPQPPESSWAWGRAAAGARLAICGVTHTLASWSTVSVLQEMVVAPFDGRDRLICPSRAVLDVARAIVEARLEHLGERLGGRPIWMPRLTQLPLGVDEERHRPATPAQRAEARRRLGIGHEDAVALFVGRLSHHAKAQPFPLLRAVEGASAGRRTHLVLCGWFAHEAVRRAFIEGASLLAPSVRTHVVDGLDPYWRDHAWDAADVFVSLADSIQETFGLSVVEAQARGLPVLASDWNGYRDLVIPGSTGDLVPTAMVAGALPTQARRLAAGELGYDQFLAEIGQAVVVDSEFAARRLREWLADPPRLHALGAAARRHAVESFSWRRVIRDLRTLWDEQLDWAAGNTAKSPASNSSGSARATDVGEQPLAAADAAYPPIERLYRGYPTQWLADDSRLIATPDAEQWLPRLLALPVVHHVPSRRLADEPLLQSLLSTAAEPQSLRELSDWLEDRYTKSSTPAVAAPEEWSRATLAWLLKYSLLRLAP